MTHVTHRIMATHVTHDQPTHRLPCFDHHVQTVDQHELHLRSNSNRLIQFALYQVVLKP